MMNFLVYLKNQTVMSITYNGLTILIQKKSGDFVILENMLQKTMGYLKRKLVLKKKKLVY